MVRLFSIYMDNILIGKSEFESGDPPMSVANGKYLPEPTYLSVKDKIIDLFEDDQAQLNLHVSTEDGVKIMTIFVRIEDYSKVLDDVDVDIEVTMALYNAERYQELFPHQCQQYFGH